MANMDIFTKDQFVKWLDGNDFVANWIEKVVIDCHTGTVVYTFSLNRDNGLISIVPVE